MPDCPQENLLRCYHNGLLEEEQAERIEKHIAACDTCQRQLDGIRAGDLSARIIRAAATSEPRPKTGAGTEANRTGELPADDGAEGTAPSEGALWDIPDYDRVRLCGEGAYGTVWAVRDRVGLHRALKVIDQRPLRAAHGGSREMAALETYCRCVGNHPNLVQIFHVGMSGPLLYYVMELADDETTRNPVRDVLPENYRPLTLQRVLRRGRLEAELALEIALRLLRGLARLHAMGLVHRDIKPANVIFVNRQPKLADIGMVIRGDTEAPLVGTPEYMPPDQRMDRTADIYAMGKVLHEMLCGTSERESADWPEPKRSSGSWWDMDGVARCIARACADRAADRYAGADRMLEDLESCRLLSLESLLPRDGDRARSAGTRRPDRLTMIATAAIGALPWILGLVLAIIIVMKFL
jgi:serine/threonine protein kinase